jgi:hypothetical protein
MIPVIVFFICLICSSTYYDYFYLIISAVEQFTLQQATIPELTDKVLPCFGMAFFDITGVYQNTGVVINRTHPVWLTVLQVSFVRTAGNGNRAVCRRCRR